MEPSALSHSFIAPMQALAVEKLPEGDFIYEVKLDGYRALAFKNGKEVRLVNNKPLDYPQLIDSLKLLPAAHIILGGEIVALDQKGGHRFSCSRIIKAP